MYRRRPYEDEADGHERWLISYADFITLLFAFFVVMYATSTINLNKYRALSSAVVTAFQGTSNPAALTSPGAAAGANHAGNALGNSATTVVKPLPLSYLYQEKRQRDQEKLRTLGQALSYRLAPWIEQKQVMVFQSESGLDIDVVSSQLFNGHEATLGAQANPLLARIEELLRNEARMVLIEGHTDRHVFAGLAGAESKRWALSAAQAALVSSRLIEGGLPSKAINAIGLADTQPVSSSENVLAQTLNSRITIRILSAEVADQLRTTLANRIPILASEPPPLPATEASAVQDATTAVTAPKDEPAPNPAR